MYPIIFELMDQKIVNPTNPLAHNPFYCRLKEHVIMVIKFITGQAFQFFNSRQPSKNEKKVLANSTNINSKSFHKLKAFVNNSIPDGFGNQKFILKARPRLCPCETMNNWLAFSSPSFLVFK